MNDGTDEAPRGTKMVQEIIAREKNKKIDSVEKRLTVGRTLARLATTSDHLIFKKPQASNHYFALVLSILPKCPSQSWLVLVWMGYLLKEVNSQTHQDHHAKMVPHL